MLQEMKDIRQVPGEAYRRCFSDDFFDLFVWFAPSGSITGFQLCYEKGPNEKALTWFRDSEFSHERVDDGEGIPYHYKMTPILIPDGSFDIDTVLRKFKEASREIDSAVADFVCTKIMGIRMIKRLVFLYDSTIQPWDITIQPWDIKFKAIQNHLTVLQAKGFKCELLDTKDMPEEELEHWRKEATSVAVLRHQQIRQFFGSLRQGGLPYLGKQVPALLVYEEGENVPVAIYPHSEKSGREYTEYFIKGFLEELAKDRSITVREERIPGRPRNRCLARFGRLSYLPKRHRRMKLGGARMAPQEDLWVYHPPSRNIRRVILGAFSLMFLLFFLSSIIQRANDIPLFGYLFMIGCAIGLFWMASSNIPARIEIDRKQGTIKKRSQIFFFIRRVKFYRLSNFNTIKVTPSYMGNWYVALCGPTSAGGFLWKQDVFSAALPILSVPDKEKAKGYARDLADFLGFEFKFNEIIFLWTGAALDRR